MEKLTVSIHSSEDTWFGVLVDADDRLIASSFSRRRTPRERLSKTAESITGSKPEMSSNQYSQVMSRIFAGKDSQARIKYNPVLATPFQSKVYDVLKKIPKGRVTTYGMIASAIRSGPRAVGTAVASSPWSLFVPCHRVIPFDLTVGNYSLNQRPDEEGCHTKEGLLRREGVLFRDDMILPPSVWMP